MQPININFTIDPSVANLPSGDIFMLILFGTAVLLYSFFVSRKHIILILVSLYSALAVMLATPLLISYLASVPADQYVLYRVSTFVGLFLLFFLLFSQRASLRTESDYNWFQAFIMSFLQVGLLASSIILLLPDSLVPSEIAKAVFTGDVQRTFWMVAPALGLLVMKRRDSTPKQ